MSRPFRCPLSIAVAILIAAPRATSGQLRPLEGLQWRLYEGSREASGEVGAAHFTDQRASLAGTTGDLWEIGNFALAWRTGRVILEAAGTAQRRFREHSRFAPPYADVEAADGGHRNDSGDYRISTVVRLTPDDWSTFGVLRFGTRLPTTDNTIGLDRDAIDFFATVGAGRKRGALAVAGETGIGVHTTREPRFEQDDLMLYALRAEYGLSMLTGSIAALGQRHGTTHSAIRGVENLGELRAGLRLGSRRWLRVELVHGYETFSPSSGVIVTAGLVH